MLENLHYFFNDLPAGLTTGEFNETLQEWLMSINSMLESKGIVNPAYKEMGTTLVALFYYGGEFYWVNCGDSRLYLMHDGQLELITTDHSLNVLLGQSKHSNIITNCIGGGCKTSYLDMVKCTELIQPGNTLMLCTDGLTDMIDDPSLQTMMTKGATATDLCDAAVQAGGFDNVSACVINVL
jgi:protein phosphatase